MLKWTSESEYFLSFEKNFADTYKLYNPVQEQSLNPFAAHAQGNNCLGMGYSLSISLSLSLSQNQAPMMAIR